MLSHTNERQPKKETLLRIQNYLNGSKIGGERERERERKEKFQRFFFMKNFILYRSVHKIIPKTVLIGESWILCSFSKCLISMVHA